MISLEMCAQELDIISDVSLKRKSLNQDRRLSIVFTFTATSSITGRNEALKNKFLPLAQILVIHFAILQAGRRVERRYDTWQVEPGGLEESRGCLPFF